MIKLSKNELDFLRMEKVARVSTMSDTGWPQTTPVLYLFHEGHIYFTADHSARKFQHLKENGKVSIVVDVYGRKIMGIAFQGNAEFVEMGQEFGAMTKRFAEAHDYYRKNPLREGEPIIRVVPSTKSSWGL